MVTGKGGVGKTTLAMAITKALQEEGKKVLYNSFDQPLNQTLASKIDLPHFNLEMDSSARSYIAKKLGSETIAKWILKTPFFSSLFNMLPGLGHMILLGHIINKLEEDSELTIVLDSPSSGHAITMMESPRNFKEMFRTGLIVDDINRMERFIFEDERMNVVVTSLPTAMATQEAHELKEQLASRGVPHFSLVLNDLLSLSPSLKEASPEDLPEFIRTKCLHEERLLSELSDEEWKHIPHFAHERSPAIIKECQHLLTKGAPL